MRILELLFLFPAGWIDARFYAPHDFPRTVSLFDGIARKYESSELSTPTEMLKIMTDEDQCLWLELTVASANLAAKLPNGAFFVDRGTRFLSKRSKEADRYSSPFSG